MGEEGDLHCHRFCSQSLQPSWKRGRDWVSLSYSTSLKIMLISPILNLLFFPKAKSLGMGTYVYVCLSVNPLGSPDKYFQWFLSSSLQTSWFLRELKLLNFNSFQQPLIEYLSGASRARLCKGGAWIRNPFLLHSADRSKDDKHKQSRGKETKAVLCTYSII